MISNLSPNDKCGYKAQEAGEWAAVKISRFHPVTLFIWGWGCIVVSGIVWGFSLYARRISCGFLGFLLAWIAGMTGCFVLTCWIDSKPNSEYHHDFNISSPVIWREQIETRISRRPKSSGASSRRWR